MAVTRNVIPYLNGEDASRKGDFSAGIREYLGLCMTAIADGIATPSLIQSVMVNAGEYILAQINARLAEPKFDDQEWRSWSRKLGKTTAHPATSILPCRAMRCSTRISSHSFGTLP